MERRRRFTPSILGLETRALLSTTTKSNVAATSTTNANTNSNSNANTNSGLPESISDKLTQIERIPTVLLSYAPNRKLPQAAVTQIQTNLTILMTRLQQARPQTVTNFNVSLRGALADKSISRSEAQQVSQKFEAVLESAGAPAGVAQQIQQGVDQIVQVGYEGQTPSHVAGNDYAFILQRALQVGKPLAKPNKPVLSSSSRGSNATTSKLANPIFQGSYAANVQMNLLDSGGNVIGTAMTAKNGTYTIQSTVPFANGSYEFRVQANEGGFLSPPSNSTTIKIQVKS